MTTTGDLRIDDWVAHRPNVVRSVAARVPGIDAAEATSRALEKMVRLATTGTTIEDPAPYWRRAALNEAISMTREAGRTRPVEDDTLQGLTPPTPGAELDTERHTDITMLRTALADLAHEDRQLLLDRHVHDRAVTDIATTLAIRPHALTMRLRRAEERLAGAFAAAHAHNVNHPECRTTRAAMHDYLKGRLLPRRQRRLEVHMDGCTDCTRAFIDVREVSWMLRDLGQHLITATLVTGTAGGGAGDAGGAAGAAGGKPRSLGKKETAVAAGVLAALAIGGGAAALIGDRPDQAPVQAIENTGNAAGGSGAGGGGAGSAEDPIVEEQPSSIPPADPQPRPATTAKEDAAAAPAGEPPVVAEPAPAPAPADPREPPATGSGPDSEPDRQPGGDTDNPPATEPAVPTTQPTEPPAPPAEPPEDPGPPPVPLDAPDVPADPPDVPADPPGPGTALEDVLADLGLSDLPGLDLATITLNEIWELLFGTFANAAGDAESATGD